MIQGLLVAIARIVLGLNFFLFGASKIFASAAFNGKAFVDFFPEFVNKALQGPEAQPYWFYRPFLEHVVLPHSAWFAWTVAIGELLLGICLVLGYRTRIASLLGVALIAAIHFCDSPFAKPLPFSSQLGLMLPHLSLILLFLTFAAVGAGSTLGLDGAKKKSKSKSDSKETAS